MLELIKLQQNLAIITMDQQRVPMFIPRVALVNSSSNSSNQSSSQYRHRSRKADWSEESGESDGFYAEKNKVAGSKSRANRKKEIYYVHKGPKRSKAGSTHTTESSSTSSLSSSNRSSHSVNSLLLSVENLENFNRTNAAANKSNRLQPNSFVFDTNSDRKQQMMENIKSILAVEDLTLSAAAAATTSHGVAKKTTKDPDELSSTSSVTTTNFTVVTFNDNHRKAIKSKSFCRRSHQVTILILVMTGLFVVGISALVCALEMRFSQMPR